MGGDTLWSNAANWGNASTWTPAGAVPAASAAANSLVFYGSQNKEVTIAATTARNNIAVHGGEYTFTINPGVVWNTGVGGGVNLSFYGNATIKGEGTMSIWGASDNFVSRGHTLTIDARVEANTFEIYDNQNAGGGTVILTNPNNDIPVFSLGEAAHRSVLAFTGTGTLGTSSQTGAITFYKNSVGSPYSAAANTDWDKILRFDGSEDSVFYHSIAGARGTLLQNGTGALEWRGAVGLSSETFTLSNSFEGTGAAIFTGTMTGNVAKTGLGTWTLAGNAKSATSYTVRGGLLDITTNLALTANTNFQVTPDYVANPLTGEVFASQSRAIITGDITGSGTFNKFGSGDLLLEGDYTSTGALTVKGGTMRLTGSKIGTSDLGTALDTAQMDPAPPRLILSGGGSFQTNTLTASGKIILDFSEKSADLVSPTATLYLNNGTLEIDGGTNTGAISQTFVKTRVGIDVNVLQINQGAASSVTVDLGEHDRVVADTLLLVRTEGDDITVKTGAVTTGDNATSPHNRVFYNGHIASTSNGRIVALADAGYENIPAHGATLPATSTKPVRIVDGGSAGSADTALSAASSVYALWMEASDNATIATNGNTLTLTNGIIGIAPGAGDLTIGTTSSRGTLAGASSRLNLVAAKDTVLTVNSVITNLNALAVSGGGKVVLTADSAYGGSVVVTDNSVLEVPKFNTDGGGSSSPLGSQGARGLYLFEGGTLRYTGSATSNGAYGKLYYNVYSDGTGCIEIANPNAKIDLYTVKGGFTKTGPGVLQVGGTATNVGLVIVAEGVFAPSFSTPLDNSAGVIVKSGATMRIINGNGLKNRAPITLEEGATLDLAGNYMPDIGGSIYGSGDIVNTRNTAPVAGFAGTNAYNAVMFFTYGVSATVQANIGSGVQLVTGTSTGNNSGTGTYVSLSGNNVWDIPFSGLRNGEPWMVRVSSHILAPTVLEFTNRQSLGDYGSGSPLKIFSYGGQTIYSGDKDAQITGFYTEYDDANNPVITQGGDLLKVTNPDVTLSIRRFVNYSNDNRNHARLGIDGNGTVRLNPNAPLGKNAMTTVWNGTLELAAELRDDGTVHALSSTSGTNALILMDGLVRLIGDRREAHASGNQISSQSRIAVMGGVLDLNGQNERFVGVDTVIGTNNTNPIKWGGNNPPFGLVTNLDTEHVSTLKLGYTDGACGYYGGVGGNLILFKEGAGGLWLSGNLQFSGQGGITLDPLAAIGEVQILTTEAAAAGGVNNLGKVTVNDKTLSLLGTAGMVVTDFGPATSIGKIDLSTTAGAKPFDAKISGADTPEEKVTYAGLLTGTRPFTKSGPGTLLLTNVNSTFTGNITVEGGVLEVPVVRGTGNSPIGPGNASRYLMLLNGATFRYTGTTASDPTGTKLAFTLAGDGTGFLDLVADRGATMVDLDRFTWGFTKLGEGTLYLGGSSGNARKITIGTTERTGGTVRSGKSGSAGGIAAEGAEIVWGTLILNTATQVIDTATITLNGAGGDDTKAVFNVNAMSETIGALDGPAGTVTSSGGILTINTAAGTEAAYGGILTGGFGITKSGTGTQILSGTGDHTGATSVSAGTLRIAPGGALTATAITVNAATLIADPGTRAGASLKVANAAALAVLNDGASTGALEISAGQLSISGTARATSLAFTGGSSLRFDAGSKIQLTSGVTVTGSPAVTLLLEDLFPTILGYKAANPGLSSYKYTLVSSDSTWAAALPAFSVPDNGGLRPGALSVIKENTRDIALDYTDFGLRLSWTNAAGDSVWKTGASGQDNWKLAGGATPSKFYYGDFVTFDLSATPGGAATLAETVRPQSVTITGGAASDKFSISGTGSINSIGPLIKEGAGELVLKNITNSFSFIEIREGTITLDPAARVKLDEPQHLGTASILMRDGATLRFGRYTSKYDNTIANRSYFRNTLTVPEGEFANLVFDSRGNGDSYTCYSGIDFANYLDTGKAGTFVITSRDLGTDTPAHAYVFLLTFVNGDRSQFNGTIQLDSRIKVDIGNAHNHTFSGPIDWSSTAFSTGPNSVSVPGGLDSYGSYNDGSVIQFTTNGHGGVQFVKIRELKDVYRGGIMLYNIALDIVGGKISRAYDSALDGTSFALGNRDATRRVITSSSGTLEIDAGLAGSTIEPAGNGPIFADYDASTPLRLVKTGEGTLKLKSSNTFTGGTEIRAGIVYDGTDQNFLGGAGKPVQIGVIGSLADFLSGAATSTARLVLDAGTTDTLNVVNNYTLAGGTLEIRASATSRAPSAAFTGNITGFGTLLKTGDSNAGRYQLSGVTISLDPGSLIHVEKGELQAGKHLATALGSANWQPNQAGLRVDAAAAFNLGGTKVYIGALTGAGNIYNSLNAATTALNQDWRGPWLTLGRGDASGTFSGSILAGINANANTVDSNGTIQAYAPINVVKTGAGTQTFTGANTLTTLAVNGGALEIGGTLSTLAATGAITVTQAGATGDPVILRLLGGASVTGAGVGLDGANTRLHFANETAASLAAPLTGAGSLLKTGAGVAVLGGDPGTGGGFTGATSIAAGTLAVSRNNAIASSSGVTLDGAGAVLDLSSGALLDASATLRSIATSHAVASLRIGGRAVQIGVHDAGSASTTRLFAGEISGAGGVLVKDGLETLLLSNGANSFGASPAVSLELRQGTLEFTSAGALGTAGAGISIRDGATLRYLTGAGIGTGAYAPAPGAALDLSGRLVVDGTGASATARAFLDIGLNLPLWLGDAAAPRNSVVLGDILERNATAGATSLYYLGGGRAEIGSYAGDFVVVNPGVSVLDAVPAPPGSHDTSSRKGALPAMVALQSGRHLGALTNAYELGVTGGSTGTLGQAFGTADTGTLNSGFLSNTTLNIRLGGESYENDTYRLAGTVTVGAENTLRFILADAHVAALDGAPLEGAFILAEAGTAFANFARESFGVILNINGLDTDPVARNRHQGITVRHDEAAHQIKISFLDRSRPLLWTGFDSGTTDTGLRDWAVTNYNWLLQGSNPTSEINFTEWSRTRFTAENTSNYALRVVNLAATARVSDMKVTSGTGWSFTGAAGHVILGRSETGADPVGMLNSYGDGTLEVSGGATAGFHIGVDFEKITVTGPGTLARFNATLRAYDNAATQGVSVSNGATLVLGMADPVPPGATPGLDAATTFLLDGTLAAATLATPEDLATAARLTLGAGNHVTLDGRARILVGTETTRLILSAPIGEASTPAILEKTGPGTLVLENANNTHSGGTVIAGGVLQFSASTLGGADGGVLGRNQAANKITLAGGTLRWTGATASVPGISLEGRLEVAAGGSGTIDTSHNSGTGQVPLYPTYDLGAVGGTAASSILNTPGAGNGGLLRVTAFPGSISGGHWSLLAGGAGVGTGKEATQYSIHGPALGTGRFGALEFDGVTLDIRTGTANASDTYAIAAPSTIGANNIIGVANWNPGTFTIATGAFDGHTPGDITLRNNEPGSTAGLFDTHQGRTLTVATSAITLRLANINSAIVWRGENSAGGAPSSLVWAPGTAATATTDMFAAARAYDAATNPVTFFKSGDSVRFDSTGRGTGGAASSVVVAPAGITVADMAVLADYAFSGGSVTGDAAASTGLSHAATGALLVAGADVTPGSSGIVPDTFAYSAAPASVSVAGALGFQSATIANATLTLAPGAALSATDAMSGIVVADGGALTLSTTGSTTVAPLTGTARLTLSAALPGATPEGRAIAGAAADAGSGGVLRTTGTANVSLGIIPVVISTTGTFDVRGQGLSSGSDPQVLSLGNALSSASTTPGADTLRKLGAGTLELNAAAPAFHGAVEVGAGTLALRNINAIGTASNASGGAIDIDTGATLRFALGVDGSGALNKGISGGGRLLLETASAYTLALGGANGSLSGLIEVLGNNATLSTATAQALGTADIAAGDATRGGTLAFTGSVALDAGPADDARRLTLGASGRGGVSVAAGAEVSFSGRLLAQDGSAAATLNKDGGGLFALTGANAAFAAGVAVRAGTLVLGHATQDNGTFRIDAAGSGPISVSGVSAAPGGHATVSVASSGLLANRLDSPAGASAGLLDIGLDAAGAAPVEVTIDTPSASVVSGYAGRVAVHSGATLTLHGAPARNIGSASQLILGDTAAASPGADTRGVLRLVHRPGDDTSAANSVTLAQATSLAVQEGGALAEIGAGNTLTLTGSGFTGAGLLEKTGAGTLRLAHAYAGGSDIAAFTGPVSVLEGVLEINSAGNLGPGTGGLVTLGGAGTTGELRTSGGSSGTLSRGILVADGGGILNTAQNLTLNGTFTGGASAELRKRGNAALTFADAAGNPSTRAFEGRLFVEQGTLTLNSANAFSDAGVVEVATAGNPGTSFTAYLSTFAAQAFRNLTLNPGASLSMNGSPANRDLAIAPGGVFLHAGNSTGVRNLSIGAGGALTITVNRGLAIPNTLSISGDAVLGAGSTIAIDGERSIEAGGVVTFASGVDAQHPTTLRITSHTGEAEYVAIAGADISLGEHFSVLYGVTPTQPSPIPVPASLDRFVDVTYSIRAGAVSGRELVIRSELLWNGRTHDGDAFDAHGTFHLPLAGEQFTIGGGTGTASATILADRGSAESVAAFSDTWDAGASHGLGGWDGRTLSVGGAGRLILAGANTYTGGSVITGNSVLRLAHASSATGGRVDSAGDGAITFDGGAGAQRLELAVAGAASVLFDNLVQDAPGGASGTIEKLLSNTVAITATLTTNATVLVSSGELALFGAGGAIARAGGLEVAPGAVFSIAGSARAYALDLPTAYAGLGAGALAGAAGTGAYVPVLRASGAGGAGTPVLRLGDNTLATSGGEFDGAISGAAGALVKIGAGSLTLSGSNTHGGGTLVYEGTLVFTNPGALGSGQLVFPAHEAGATDNPRVLMPEGSFQVANTILVAPGGSARNHIEIAAGDRVTLGAANAIQAPATAIPADSAVLRKQGGGTLALYSVDALASFHGVLALDAGTLEIRTGAVDTALSGNGGSLAVVLAGTDVPLEFKAGSLGATAAGYSPFSGTVQLGRGRVTLADTGASRNASFLQNASLSLGAGATAIVTDAELPGGNRLAGIRLDGGTLDFTASPLVPERPLEVGTLEATANGGRIVINGLQDNTGSGVSINTALPSGQNIFDHSDAQAARQILRAETIAGDAGNLQLLALAPDASAAQRRPVTGGVATFDYGALLGTVGGEKGVFLTYTLVEVSANTGGLARLSAVGAQDPALLARLTGTGGFEISGTSPAQRVPVGNAASDYSGPTTLDSVTVVMLNERAFGGTANLRLQNGAVLDTRGEGAVPGSAGSASREVAVLALDGTAGTRIVTASLSGPGNSVSARSGDFSGVLSGGASLVKTGDGTATALVLRGVNLHTGETLVRSGTLELRDNGSIEASSRLALDAAGAGVAVPRLVISSISAQTAVVRSLDAGAGSGVTLGAKNLQIGLSGAGQGEDPGNGSGLVRAAIGGVGGLVKEGEGLLEIAAANTFSGGVILNGGDLRLSAASAAGTGAITHASDGALKLADGLAYANNLLLHEAAPRVVETPAGGSATLSGLILGAGSGAVPSLPGLVVNGGGMLRLSNAAALDSFTGSVEIATAADTLLIHGRAFHNTLSGAGTLRVERPLDTDTFAFEGGAVGAAFTGTLEIAKGRVALVPQNAAPLAGAMLRLDAGATGVVDSASTARFASLVLDGGALEFPVSGLSTQGSLQAGTLRITAAGAVVRATFDDPLDTAAPGASALFDLHAGSASAPLTLVSTSGGVSVDGLPPGEVPGNLSLVNSAGQSIAGASASEAARTRELRTGGTRTGSALFLYGLDLGTGDSFQLSRRLVRIEADAGRIVRLDAAGSLDARLDAELRGQGGFEITGSRGQTISLGNAASAYSGATSLTEAAFRLTTENALGATSSLTLGSHATLDLAGHGLRVGALHNSDGTVEIRLTGDGSSLSVNGGGTYAGALAGEGTLLKTGGETLTLTGASSSTGAILVSGGLLQLKGRGLLGADGPSAVAGDFSGAVEISGAGSRLVLAQDGAQTLSGRLTGQGLLVVEGPGETLLAGTQNAHGGTAVLGGTLILSDARNLGAAQAGNLLDGGTLRLEGAASPVFADAWMLGAGASKIMVTGTATLSGKLSGAGGFEKTGAGELILGTGNAQGGATTVTGGTLRIHDDSALGTGNLVLNGGTVRLSGLDYARDWVVSPSGGFVINEERVIHSGLITGSGILEKRGAGLFEVQGRAQVPVRVLTGAVGGDGFLDAPRFAEGTTISPGGAGGAFGVLTLGVPGETVELNGVILALDISADPDATPNCDLISIAGDAAFGNTRRNILDLSSSGAVSDFWWGDGEYTILRAAGSLVTGDLSTTLFRYRGVNLGEGGDSRLAATLEKSADGKGLVLRTYASASEILDWNGGSGSTYWNVGSEVDWKEDGGGDTVFNNGDIVRFLPNETLMQVTVTEFNNGVIVGSMQVGGKYAFKGGKIVGTATRTSGPGLIPDGWLRVIETGDATFENELDFEGIEVRSGGSAEFRSTVVAHLPVVLNGTIILSGDAVRGLTGVLEAPEVLNNGQLILGDGETRLASPVSGSGSLLKTGGGVAVLSGENTHTGGTRVEGGTLAIASDGALGAGAKSLDGGTLRLDGAEYAASWTLGPRGGSIEVPANIAGEAPDGTPHRATFSGGIAPADNAAALSAQGFAKLGGGTLALSGTLDSGALTLAEGQLEIVAGGALGPGAVFAHSVTIAEGATLIFGSGAAQTLTAPVGGAGAIIQRKGTLRLDGEAHVHTVGSVTVESGTATVAGTLNAGWVDVISGVLRVNNATLDGDGLSNAGIFAATGTLNTSSLQNLRGGTANVVSANIGAGTLGNAGLFVASETITGGARLENEATGILFARSIALSAGTLANAGSLFTTSLTAATGMTNAADAILLVASDGGGNPLSEAPSGTTPHTPGPISTAGTLQNAGWLRAGAVNATAGLENSGTLQAESITATAGTVANSGVLLANGVVTGTVRNSTGGDFSAAAVRGRLENASGAVAAVGDIRDGADNSGVLSISGNVTNGDVINRQDATFTLSTPGGHTISGALRNDGLVRFANFGTVLAPSSLANATSGGRGLYEVEIDFSSQQQTDHFELDPGAPVEGTHIFRVTGVANAAGARRDTRLHLIIGGTVDPGAHIALAAPVEAGIYQYDILDHRTATLECTGLSNLASASLNTIGLTSQGWFSQLDNIQRHQETVRSTAHENNARRGADGEGKAPGQGAAAVLDNTTWLRATTTRLTASFDIPGISDATLTQYAGDVGYDHHFAISGGATLVTGVFAGYQTSRVKFKGAAGRGDIDSALVGVQALFVTQSGWFADAILKAQHYGVEYSSQNDRAKYDANALGISAAIGRRLELGAGWFADFRAAADYAHHFNESHSTRHGARATLSDSDDLRLGATFRIGKLFHTTTRGTIELSARLGGEYRETLADGAVRYSPQDRYAPNLDGLGATCGVGLHWQPVPSHHLTLDYDAGLAVRQTRPLTLSASYQYRF